MLEHRMIMAHHACEGFVEELPIAEARRELLVGVEREVHAPFL
jgi:hypothetical protein